MQAPEYKPEKWNEKSAQFGFSNVQAHDFSRNAFNTVLDLNPKSILDIGCCTGDYILAWRKSGYKGKYLGIDVTSNFVTEAKTRVSADEFLVANLYDYKSKKKYDLVVCQNVLMHLPEIEKAIKNICSLSNDYVFLSFYGTEGETTTTHDENFLNFHYNVEDVLEHVPDEFEVVENNLFKNGYHTISIIQLLLKRK
jgi:predicted TPR repeat methyltransferase